MQTTGFLSKITYFPTFLCFCGVKQKPRLLGNERLIIYFYFSVYYSLLAHIRANIKFFHRTNGKSNGGFFHRHSSSTSIVLTITIITHEKLYDLIVFYYIEFHQNSPILKVLFAFITNI